jgi:hypothetical protein
MDDQEPDPRFWSLERKWAHHVHMAEKLIDSHPELAQIWLSGADLLQLKMCAIQGSTPERVSQ